MDYVTMGQPRGVLLLGGKGTRVQAITGGRNKHLCLAGGVTLAEHGLRFLVRSGIKEISVVCPPADLADIKRLFRQGRRDDIEIGFVVQPAPLGTADAVMRASQQAGPANPTVVLFGDNLFELPQSCTSHALRPSALGELYLAETADPRHFGVVQLTRGGAIGRIDSKPAAPASNIVCTGLMKFAPGAIDIIADLAPNPAKEIDLMDLARILLRRGQLDWRWIRGWWKDVATDADTLAAACRSR